MELESLELVEQELSLGVLKTNAAEIKSFIEEKMKEYVPENYIGRVDIAKKDRAILNSLAKTVNDKRISLEKRWMAPFLPSKELIDESVKIIKKVVSHLDDNIIKVEEEREKEEKKTKIETYYAGKGFTLLTLDRIFNSRWLNKTVKDKEWKDEIDGVIVKIYADIKTLETFPAEDADTLKAFYLDVLDIGQAIAKGNQMKANREALAKEKETRVIREEKQEETQAKKQLEGEIIQELKETQTEAVIDYATGEVKSEDAVYTITLRFSGTMAQLAGVRQYMAEHKIKYEKI